MNAEIEQRSQRVAELFAATTVAGAEAAEAERGWARFRHRLEGAERERGWGWRPAWWGAAAGVVLIGVLGLSPAARSAAAEVLSLFRIRQVTALPLDLDASAPVNNPATMTMIRQMLSDDVTVTREVRDQSVASVAEASELAGFTVRYPEAMPAAKLLVTGGQDVHLSLDRERAQAILDEAGVVGIRLPASLDGATIAVHVPRMVAVLYGSCGSAVASGGEGLPQAPAVGGCTVLDEGPSPTAQLPPGLDMPAIADAGLQLLGVSPSAAAAICSNIDWTSTLVVPFPRDRAQAQTVTVDGAQGVLLTEAAAALPAEYELVWTREGMLYSISGSGDGSQGLSLAAQLPPS